MNKWIPVTERLPEVTPYDAREFLVTVPNFTFIGGNKVTTLFYGYADLYGEGYSDEPLWFDFDSIIGDIPYANVIAWMPLPKPYEVNNE